MLTINSVRWGKYLQISVTRSSIYIDILHTNQDTALLYHFVDAISPFLTFDPLPRYISVKVPDSTHSNEQIGKAVASIQYTLGKITDINDMIMPTILVLRFSEINPKDLNARSSSGDEYYGLFEKTAICSKMLYLLIPPRMILGHPHQLDIDDLIVYDGVQLIKSYKELQAISALNAVVYAYRSIRFRLIAMQKRAIKRNEAFVAQYIHTLQQNDYNELDTCSDRCMRHANANLHIPKNLETSDDIRAYIEEENIPISPTQRQYLYSTDLIYKYLMEVEAQEKNKQPVKSVHFATHVGDKGTHLSSVPPEALMSQFKKQLFQTQQHDSELPQHIDKLFASPSFTQTYFNLQSVCSDVQALSNTSMQVDCDCDIEAKELIQLTHATSDLFTPFTDNLSQMNLPQRSFSQPIRQQRLQSLNCAYNSSDTKLNNSHITSATGLASAVHAFEIPFDPQSSIQNRTASVRLSSRSITTATQGCPSKHTNPCSPPAGVPQYKRTSYSLPVTEQSYIFNTKGTRQSKIYENEEIKSVIVSGERMNEYNVKLLSLHYRVNNWEDLDICQRIELVKEIIHFLYLPDFCHVCCKDKQNFKKASSNATDVTDATNIFPQFSNTIISQIAQYESQTENTESLQNILMAYRKTLSAKGLLRDEMPSHYYKHTIDTEAIFVHRNRPTTTYSISKTSGENVKHKLPPILPSSSVLSKRLGSKPATRSISLEVGQSKSQSMIKSNRSVSIEMHQSSCYTPDPTMINGLSPLSEKTGSSSHSEIIEKKDVMIDKMGAQMASFVVYCKFSNEYRKYLPTIKKIISAFMHSISTVPSFELEANAVYCPKCSIFLGCCQRCASISSRSHQTECANFVAIKLFSRMNDRQLEDCCRFEESQPVQKVVQIDSTEANRLRGILSDFDNIALRDMNILQNYLDEKPKVTERESDIIKDYREQYLGSLSYTDKQIHSFQQQTNAIVEKIDSIIKQKNDKYNSIKDSAKLPQIPESITAELTKALTNKDADALHTVLRSLLELRKMYSDALVSDIKNINTQDKGREHNIAVFFTNLIDLLRSQYQNDLDELHIQQECAIHERFLAITADLRLCSLLEIQKRDILGYTAKLSQKRFNPIIPDTILSSSARRSKRPSLSATEAVYTNIFDAMKDLAMNLSTKEQVDHRKRKDSVLKSAPNYELDCDSNISIDPTESVRTLGSLSIGGQHSQELFNESYEENNLIENQSFSNFSAIIPQQTESKSEDCERKIEKMITPRLIPQKNISKTSLEQRQKLSLESSSIGEQLGQIHNDFATDTLYPDPYLQYLIKQLPRHMAHELITTKSYLGYRRPNSTVMSFPPEVYPALKEQDSIVIILGSGTQNLTNEGSFSQLFQGSALAHAHTNDSDLVEEEQVLNYYALTYNSIYMMQPDLLLAIDELQHILGQSELFYNDIPNLIAQHSAQLRLQHKITQIKSGIKKELYALAKTSRQNRHGGEAIKITNQEVEYEYIKRHGHDMRKFIFSFPKSHSEILYEDNIEAMKAIIDSLLPLYQYTQIYLSKTQTSVHRLERVVKDKKSLLKKISTNLDKISSTRRCLSELVFAAESKLRQRQLLFEKALSASPSPDREPTYLKQLNDIEMSIPKLSATSLYSNSVSNTLFHPASVHSPRVDTPQDTTTMLGKSINRSTHMVYSQGLIPKGLKGSTATSPSTTGRKTTAKSNMKDYSQWLPSLIASHTNYKSNSVNESLSNSARSFSVNNSQTNHLRSQINLSRDKETKSDGDESHPTAIRMVARRMRRGGRRMVLTTKKPRKMQASEECSDYEFNPDDLLSLSSITIPSDKFQQESHITGEQVNMIDYICQGKTEVIAPIKQETAIKK